MQYTFIHPYLLSNHTPTQSSTKFEISGSICKSLIVNLITATGKRSIREIKSHKRLTIYDQFRNRTGSQQPFDHSILNFQLSYAYLPHHSKRKFSHQRIVIEGYPYHIHKASVQ